MLDLLPLLVPITLFAPMALTWSAFATDWGNHMFLVATMERSIRQLGRPSYFVHTSDAGLFFPFFAFYGGTLYAITAVLGIVMGSPVRAYVASYGLGFTMTYAGMYWLARLTALRSLLAHVPAIVTVTGAYYLTNAYGRGAWPEFIAVSAIPLLIAGAVDMVIGRRPRIRALVAVYGATVIFSGSHNITLLYGTLFLLLVLLAGAFALGPVAVRLHFRRLALLGLVLVLAAGTNFWFLLPDLVYAGQTPIGHATQIYYLEFDKASVLFSPWRTTGVPDAPELFVQVSVYVLAWSLAMLAIAARARIGSRQARRFAAAIVALGAGLLILTMVDEFWEHAPSLLLQIQFPYRLQSYVLLLTAAASLLAIHAAQRLRRRRLAFATLAVALACQVGLAEWQVWTPPTYVSGSLFAGVAGTGRMPHTWYGGSPYRIPSGPLVRPTARVAIPAELVHDDRITVPMPQAPGVYATAIADSPFVGISGSATDIGHTSDFSVAVAPVGTEGAPSVLTVAPRVPAAQWIGDVVSVVCPLALIALCASMWWRRRRPAHAAPG